MISAVSADWHELRVRP